MTLTSDCNCPDISPDPSCEPNEIPINCKILYYMGENNIGETGQTLLPGRLSQIYTAEKEDWKILFYSAQELFDSGLLPADKYFSNFTLTEKELLSSSTMETWEAYGASWLAHHKELGDYNTIPSCEKPFYILVCEALGIDMSAYAVEAMKFVEALISGDFSKVGSVQNNETIITPEEENITFVRKEGCWNWFKSIYDTYYGKKFLVSIGNQSPAVGGSDHASFPAYFKGFDFRGICVKDKNGDYPKYGIEGGGTNIYYVQGNGSGQGLNLSDEISTDGGFPTKNIENILGLSGVDLDFVKTEDGKIDSFVKIGYITNKDGEPVIYTKFKDYMNNEGKWFLDFTKLNTSNYFIKNTDDGNILYIKATVDNKIYFIGDVGGGIDPPSTPDPDGGCVPESDRPNGQWALITLSEQVPLSLSDTNTFSALDIMKFMFLVTQDSGATSKNFQLCERIGLFSSIIGNARNKNGSPVSFGTLNSSSILNILQVSAVSLIPEGVVIPMKSNVYSYGPYYYDGLGQFRDNTGGTEFIKYDILAPWNFAINSNGVYDTQNAYDAMNCTGAKLAIDSSKGLQQLEKGRITLAELPSYSLGHSVDSIDIFPDGDGPTILTDISVDYGSSGFRTTYNFQTFTPKFGRDSKKLIDRLNQKIKENNENSLYLRQERLKNSTIFKNLQQNISERNKSTSSSGSISPIFNKKSTPHKLLISGYYLRLEDLDNSPGDIPDPSSEPDCCDSQNEDETFDPCKDREPISTPSISPFPSIDRIYSFAETSEAYQTTYIQQTYKQLHIMSTDGLYLPVSLKGDCNPSSSPNCNNTGRIPRFAMRTENNGSYVEWNNSDNLEIDLYDAGYPNPSKSRDEIPPFKLIGSSKTKSYSLPINQLYLNPMTSSKILEDWDSRKNNTTKGFVISSIAFGDKFTDYQLTHNDLGEDTGGEPKVGDDEILRQQQDNFRFSALRGPLVLQGWGYDTAGKPIPNHSDTAYNTERGKFKKSGLTDKFMQGWIENPRTWPVGPVDLRFDRERGVWTCPSPNKIVVARLKQNLRANGKAQAELVNPKAADIRFYQNYNISGPDGENVKLKLQNAVIMVYDFIGVDICANNLVYAYYDDNRYIVLESGSAYKDDTNNVYCDKDNLCTTDTTTTTTTTPTCSWYGLDNLKEITNYDSTKQQVLAHDDKGCLIWIDTTLC